MAIDLNLEEPQSGFCPIPPQSRVLVSLSVKFPDEDRRGREWPLTASRHSGMEYLACVLEVLSPSFRGQKIYHNFSLSGAVTAGQESAVRISRRQIRALVESAAGILPDDDGPAAIAARRLDSWADLDGLTFPIVVDADASVSRQDGRVYVNNTLKAVITMRDADYALLRAGGEWISDRPLPVFPETTQGPAPACARAFGQGEDDPHAVRRPAAHPLPPRPAARPAGQEAGRGRPFPVTSRNAGKTPTLPEGAPSHSVPPPGGTMADSRRAACSERHGQALSGRRPSASRPRRFREVRPSSSADLARPSRQRKGGSPLAPPAGRAGIRLQ